MVKVISGFFRSVMLIVTILTCTAYLVICLIPYIDTGRYWYVSVLGLGFTLVLAVLLLLLAYWAVIRSRLWILCLVVVLPGYQQINAAFAFHFPKKFQMEKSSGALRVMQWNVHNWNQFQDKNERQMATNTQPGMMALIKKYDADVVCIEEFFESTKPEKSPSNIAAMQSIGYPYHFFAHGDITDGYFLQGIGIFSKYPIVSADEVSLGPKNAVEPVVYADIAFNGKTVRAMAIHLQSVRFEFQDYSNLSNMKNVKDPSLNGGKTIVAKLRNGFKSRYAQSLTVRGLIAESPYPLVLCGDFNDVPNSGAYFNISGGLQDAFLKRGSFVGRTFRFISPTLRIDYIMPSKDFDIQQFKLIRSPYSDHYPLIADIELR